MIAAWGNIFIVFSIGRDDLVFKRILEIRYQTSDEWSRRFADRRRVKLFRKLEGMVSPFYARGTNIRYHCVGTGHRHQSESCAARDTGMFPPVSSYSCPDLPPSITGEAALYHQETVVGSWWVHV